MNVDEPINIILANNMQDGTRLVNSEGLNMSNCAVITDEPYFEEFRLNENETVFLHSRVRKSLIEGLMRRCKADVKILNIKVVNV